VNYLLIPTLLLGLGLFALGVRLARLSGIGPKFRVLVVAAMAAAVPGVVFAAYYLRLFGEPIWLYEFRSLPLTEFSSGGAGFLAGLLHGSQLHRWRHLGRKTRAVAVSVTGQLRLYRVLPAPRLTVPLRFDSSRG
jgi:hypothetical protein